jgi:hypothetical protein
MSATAADFRPRPRWAPSFDLSEALDGVTRFLAGLNLQDHPVAVQRARDGVVHRAMAVLRPEGARVDEAVVERRRAEYLLKGHVNGMPLKPTGEVDVWVMPIESPVRACAHDWRFDEELHKRKGCDRRCSGCMSCARCGVDLATIGQAERDERFARLKRILEPGQP